MGSDFLLQALIAAGLGLAFLRIGLGVLFRIDPEVRTLRPVIIRRRRPQPSDGGQG